MIDMKAYLSQVCQEAGLREAELLLPHIALDPGCVKILMISEAPFPDPQDGFYSSAPQPEAMKTTLALFQSAGVPVKGIGDILALGVYITTAVKAPKTGYAVEPSVLAAHLPLLEAELNLFPHLKAIMLMGDVAKKAFNQIVQKRTGKNCIPPAPPIKFGTMCFPSAPSGCFPPTSSPAATC